MPQTPRAFVASINGRELKLLYDWNAIEQFENARNKDFYTLLTSIQQRRFSIGDLKAMIWAGLLHDRPDITTSEVGSWFSPSDLGAAIDKVFSAVTNQTPTEEQVDELTKYVEGDKDANPLEGETGTS